MKEAAWYSLAIVLGVLAWIISSAVIRLRQWWENEVERWSDFMREVRQFFQMIIPPLIGASVVIVMVLFYWMSR